MMKVLYIIVLVTYLSEKCLSANIDDACADDAACSGSVSNSECVKDFSNCDKGECKCMSGYTSNSGKTSCLKNTELDAACSATTFCLYSAECDSTTTTCKCASGKTYNGKLKLCITTGEKAISEECTQASDCYLNSGGMNECVVKSGSSSSTKYCTCKAGYITENYRCRKPHATESCTSSVGCVEHLALGSGQGQETEACDASKCTCPSTSDQVSRNSGETTYKLCLTKYSSKKSAGATCTSSNQCSSTYCDTCPGDSDKKCLSPVMNDGNSVVAMKGYVEIFLLAACVIASMV